MTRSLRQCVATLLLCAPVWADGLLFSYDGGVLPGDPSFDWIVADPCEGFCSVRTENGRFLLEWGAQGNLANYHHWIAQAPEPRPDSLWVEAHFRSNQAAPPSLSGCDGGLAVDFGAAGLYHMDLSAFQTVAALVTITLFVPCVASLMVMLKERGPREGLLIWTGSLILALGIGGVVAQILL